MALRRLANLLASYTPHDGPFQLHLPGTYAVRLSRLTTEATYATLGPALCVAAQGAKVVMLGREVLEYDPAHLLVLAVGLPISSQVTRASRKDPYLGFVMDLDPTRVAELAPRVYPRGIPKASDIGGLYAGRATDAIVDAVSRLLELMAHPEDTNLLGPLVVDEILIRLLRTSIGRRVAQIGNPKSGVQRIAEAVTWIRANFAQPVTVEDMAGSVHMSASSFHQRFKAITSMSPLQYQKVLRLHEARRLMLFQSMDASEACRRVGYVSPSQFSREYSRFFGSAPVKDIARLRDEGFAPPDGADRVRLSTFVRHLERLVTAVSGVAPDGRRPDTARSAHQPAEHRVNLTRRHLLEARVREREPPLGAPGGILPRRPHRERPADGHPQRAAGDRDVAEVHADGPARLHAVHVLELEPSREIRRRVEPDCAENVEEVPARAQWPEAQSHLTRATLRPQGQSNASSGSPRSRPRARPPSGANSLGGGQLALRTILRQRKTSKAPLIEVQGDTPERPAGCRHEIEVDEGRIRVLGP